ncbi:Transcriptional regulator, BadM/Rrf2 family [uncultured Alphaproteobacteria bacterium]|uniref:Transcriptional regulator, BadM/Rrf2 family n=1 Tax=uncultured Alphaproteobacteria bacterium TaxID=91750 RepID=A0A212JB95_9PROT|nr:Transcriptional regulator, BadM/Rrf2 family [uncultured Alphaproteobacteria bacterium]
MVSLSQSVGYAVLALAHMDPQGETLVLAADVAQAANIPKPYLAKILARLQAAGIVSGKRGQGGGLRLTRPAAEITLYEVADAIEGETWRTACLLGIPGCSEGKPCPMHDYWGATRAEIAARLKATTVDTVRDFTEAGWKMPETV